MTHIYAFQDNNGQWHGDPDAALVNPADKPARGWLTYQPVPGPRSEQPLRRTNPRGPLRSHRTGTRTSHLPTRQRRKLPSHLVRPHPARDIRRLSPHPSTAPRPAPAPSLETSLTHNGRTYALTATTDTNGHLTTEITVTSNDGEIHAELRGTLNLTDLHPLARLLHATIPGSAPPADSYERTWSPADSTRLADRFRTQRDFGALAQEFNCRRNDIYRRLLELELITAPPSGARDAPRNLNPLPPHHLSCSSDASSTATPTPAGPNRRKSNWPANAQAEHQLRSSARTSGAANWPSRRACARSEPRAPQLTRQDSTFSKRRTTLPPADAGSPRGPRHHGRRPHTRCDRTTTAR